MEVLIIPVDVLPPLDNIFKKAEDLLNNRSRKQHPLNPIHEHNPKHIFFSHE